MLPAFYVYITYVSYLTDLAILVFFGYYFLRLRQREKRVERKEHAADDSFHHVVDDALSKERQILDDATTEANQIITGAQYVNRASKDSVSAAIQSLIADIQKEEAAITHTFVSEFTASLKQITTDSLAQTQTVMGQLHTDLQKQVKEFHETLLPEVEKELETYKQERLKVIDQTVTAIVQHASQEIFNKTLSLTDHQALVTESLEKAKKEGVFD